MNKSLNPYSNGMRGSSLIFQRYNDLGLFVSQFAIPIYISKLPHSSEKLRKCTKNFSSNQVFSHIFLTYLNDF